LDDLPVNKHIRFKVLNLLHNYSYKLVDTALSM